MRKLSKITEGILGDIARRDLSGRKRNENLLRPHTRNEFREIVKDEIRKQGGVDIDLRHIFLPENMTSLSFLFEDYDKIESLDLTGWDTSRIETFDEMFCGCENLKNVRGIEDLDVSRAYDFNLMFYNCICLENIDLSGWKINFNPQKTGTGMKYNNIQMDKMFTGCKNLKKIIGFENLDIPEPFLKTIKRGFCKDITDMGDIIR